MSTGPIKFAEFELDRARYELRQNGKTLKLEKIPMELLLLLVTKNGDLVTRQEIEAHLWGNEVFVDAEHGINTAVRKVRQVLGDDPDRPRFVQTVQRKGYRFIGDIAGGEIHSPENGLGTNGVPFPPQPDIEVNEKSPQSAALEGNQSAMPTKLLVWIGVAACVLLVWPAIKFAPRFIRRDAPVALIRSIAVLPLENLSGDPAEEYFADGMTDELITMLAQYRSLRIISRTSVMQYKKVHRPLPEIARELGVDGIVEGSVSRTKDRVHVTAQLVYAPTDTHLWAESYDRDLGDVLHLQQKIARSIAERVQHASSLSDKSTITHAPVNTAARDAYFRGRYYWFSDKYEKSREFFQEAIRLDPEYSAAYAGLADSYTAAAVVEELRPLDGLPKGEVAAKKALELDDSLAEAHHSMAATQFFYHWDWAGAEKESERTIELNPNFAEAHHIHAYILDAMNRGDEALQEDKLSVELDPFARPWAYGYALLRARRYDDALREFKQREGARPGSAILHALMSIAYAHKGDFESAFSALKKSAGGDAETLAAWDEAFRRGGFPAVMEERLQQLKHIAAKEYISPLPLATFAARAGHREEAIRYLEQAYEQHVPRLVFLQHDPDFDSLHSDPRYWDLVKKMNMPPLQ